MGTGWKRLSLDGALRSGHRLRAFLINIGGYITFIKSEAARLLSQSLRMPKEIDD